MSKIFTFFRPVILVVGLLLATSGMAFAQSDTLLNEPLTSTLGSFTALSITGDQVWASTTYGAKISGYSSTVYHENEDWLISPALDLTGRADVYLSFEHAHKYGIDPENELTLLVSDTYKEGYMDTSTWKPVAFTHSDQSSWTYVSVSGLSLNDFAGQENIRFAFRYKSTSASCATWEIKNVMVLSANEEAEDTITEQNVIVFSESFDGFREGTYGSPNSTDISLILDTYTEASGWTGSKVYQAGGAVKCGTSTTNGSISTPMIDLSDCYGKFTVSFKSMAWLGDTTDLRIYVNGLLKQTVTELPDTSVSSLTAFGPYDLDGGTDSTVITFAGGGAYKAYRFYLDSLVVSVLKEITQPSDSATLDLTAVSFEGEVGTTMTGYVDVNAQYLTGDLNVAINSPSGAFTISQSTIPSALAMAGCTLAISYTPKSAGNDTASITVSGGGLSEEQTVIVTGVAYNVTEVANLGELRAAYNAHPSDESTIYRVTGEVVVSYTHSSGNTKYMQDATGGIMIYDTKGLIETSLDRGYGVTGLTGTFDTYGGVTELIPVSDVTVLSNDNTLVPVCLSISEYKAAQNTYESMLIQVDSLTNISGKTTWSTSKANYNVTDGTDTLVIRTNYTGLDYMGLAIPDKTNYAGIAIEYNGTPQLFPRDTADIGVVSAVEDTTVVALELTGGSCYTGDLIHLNLNVRGVSSEDNIIAYQFDLIYDGSLLYYTDMLTVGTISEAGTLVVNDSTVGVLHVSYMSVNPLTQDGTLLTVLFTTLGTGTTSPCISHFLFNADEVTAIETDTVFIKELIEYTLGDIDENDYIQAYDAALALQYSVGIDPIPDIDPIPWSNARLMAADVDGTSEITANDAALILQYSAQIISSFPIQESDLRSLTQDDATVTIEQDGENLVFKSSGNLIGLNLTAVDHKDLLGKPTVLNSTMISAVNISDDTFTMGLATAYVPDEGSAFLSIPVSTSSDATITFNLIVNTTTQTVTAKISTDLDDNSLDALSIYPNPVGNALAINGAGVGCTVSLFDISGKCMMENTLNTSSTQIDVTTLSSGIYMLKVVAGDGNRKVLKVVKK